MYVKKIIDSFKKRYGDEWLARFFAWKNAHPGQASKAVATASHKGEKIVKSLAKTKKGKARARREMRKK